VNTEKIEEQNEASNGINGINTDNGETLDGTRDEISDFLAKKDGYRNVMFGQIADGLLPPHPGEPESPESDLSQAALSDPAASELERQNINPTPWRAIVVITLAAIALAIVFWKK
jgi:hypothetical protein